MGCLGRAEEVRLADLTEKLSQEAVRAGALAGAGVVAPDDASEALEFALVVLRARLVPALDPCVSAEPALVALS